MRLLLKDLIGVVFLYLGIWAATVKFEKQKKPPDFTWRQGSRLLIFLCFRQTQKSTARLCGTNRNKQLSEFGFA
ncbi:hypothetical protein C7N83_00025 [Neisseria iguanae]|uniref:Uncharacterized protein n=1 Tax=Neisseria iguanae TaxID=90242 RepID=A0A2P7U3E8_9NEIS|nr:hypothetical protein C7N83_00025 [Neisseria iguanae]